MNSETDDGPASCQAKCTVRIPNSTGYSIADLMGEAISRTPTEESVSSLFDPCGPNYPCGKADGVGASNRAGARRMPSPASRAPRI